MRYLGLAAAEFSCDIGLGDSALGGFAYLAHQFSSSPRGRLIGAARNGCYGVSPIAER